MVRAVAAAIPRKKIAIHFHDTHGRALANILACFEEDISVVDSAIGGLGGCPYAPGASGNLATEDLVDRLDGLGVKSGEIGRAPGRERVGQEGKVLVGAVTI